MHIETLSPGDSLIKKYMVRVENVNQVITNIIDLTYGEMQKQSNTVTLNVTKGDLTIEFTSTHAGYELQAGNGYLYHSFVKIIQKIL